MENMKQFEISNSVRKELSNYLNTHNSLEKMKTFFWTKKDLMMEFINMRLNAGDKKGKN